MKPNEAYGISTVIEITDDIKTTPNEVYGLVVHDEMHCVRRWLLKDSI